MNMLRESDDNNCSNILLVACANADSGSLNNEDMGILGCYVIQLVSRYRSFEDRIAFIFSVKHSDRREIVTKALQKFGSYLNSLKTV
jgi:hypothetical protein